MPKTRNMPSQVFRFILIHKDFKAKKIISFYMIKRTKRGQVVWEDLLKWIVGIGILALVIGLFALLKVKGVDIFEQIKNIFRFGR